jgi:hypothetical protein
VAAAATRMGSTIPGVSGDKVDVCPSDMVRAPEKLLSIPTPPGALLKYSQYWSTAYYDGRSTIDSSMDATRRP